MSRATNLLEIGKMNFSQCKALTELTIPDSVTNIGESAFAHTLHSFPHTGENFFIFPLAGDTEI